MCQQFIKTKRGKRYLADLCFPSLKLYYEIDEAHHKSYQNKAKDEDRQKEIIDATDFEEHRIKVFDKNIREIDSNFLGENLSARIPPYKYEKNATTPYVEKTVPSSRFVRSKTSKNVGLKTLANTYGKI